METETLLEISKNLKYINETDFKIISDNIEEVSKILQGLIKSVQQKIKLTQTV